MWRYGYDTPINYQDNELFCGGFSRQHELNNGECGVCGDPYDVSAPRPHEAGGEFATGKVTGRYTQGAVVDLTVEITANHKGYFQFKICEAPTDPDTEVTQECLDNNPLATTDGSSKSYYLPYDSKPGLFEVSVQLPSDLTCSRCVLQWTYTAGNSWGVCSNGTGMIGCGPQETFRNCADVTIEAEQETNVIA
jgi:hypothetical protein